MIATILIDSLSMVNNSSPDSDTQNYSNANLGESAALRDLALRLLKYNLPHPEGLVQVEPQLLVKQLPEEWLTEMEIPFPEGSQILGSLVQDRAVVLFETCFTVEEVSQFYRNQMQALGWNLVELQLGSGFLSVERAQRKVFCRSSTGPSLNVSSKAMPNERTEVRLDLEPERKLGSICAVRDYHQCFQRNVLPKLVHLPNAQSLGGGAFSSEGRAMNACDIIRTEATLASLVAHYVPQIEQANWTETGRHQNNLFNWSSWSLIDENQNDWRGVFLILQIKDIQSCYYLHMQASCINSI
ncbi:hypothetical protein [Acaryochloris thomasi]|nr:hypothetical protein [Acaryochloris thomasi]